MSEDVWIKTFCQGCFWSGCAIKVNVKDDVVVGIEGDPDNPWNVGKVCAKSMAQIMTLYDPYRPRTPLVRTNPEKGKGVDPKWKEISWDEALDQAAEQLAKLRKEDAVSLVLSDNDLSAINWIPMLVMGSYGTNSYAFNDPTCGNAVHCQPYQTIGAFRQEPDYEHCHYLVLWGSEKGGMSQHAGTPAAIELARLRRDTKTLAKLVSITPHQGNMASKADEWIPIRPGTDNAMALAWLNVLLNEVGIYDEHYLVEYSNAPYLIGETGHYVRDPETNKPMMWDSVDGVAKPWNAEFKKVALDGSFVANGKPCKTGFTLLREQVKQYSPEWASPITTIPAATIRRLAREFGEAASIGSTIEIEGYTLPHRPASIHWYAGVSQHNDGYICGITLQTICLVLGLLNVPGGVVGDGSVVDYPFLPPEQRTMWSAKGGSPYADDDGLLRASDFECFGGLFTAGYPPTEAKAPLSPTGSELFPLTFMPLGTMPLGMKNPQFWNNKWPRPKMIVGRHSNDLTNNQNSDEACELFKDIYRISAEPFLDETAQFADIFFPAPTRLERLQLGTQITGYLTATQGKMHACINVSQPVVPMSQIIGREFLDIWTEVAERAGFLEELNTTINIVWDLREGYRLQPDRKYSWSELVETFAMSTYGQDFNKLREIGHLKWRRTVQERFPRPFHTGRAMLYYEHFIDAGKQVEGMLEELGIDKDTWDTSDYRPLPYWRPTEAFTDTREGFDLIAIPFRLPVLTHFWMTHNPWLVEVAEHHPWGMNIVMNRKTAKRMGIRHGDQIEVEAVSGHKQTGEVRLTECIHPEVVAVSKHGGHWCEHPVAHGKGTQFHNLISHGRMDYVDKLFSGYAASTRVRVRRT